ncbi:hypothetical protein V501_02244 [Pseudogymnoascus sp. VKM F-4519 (FW-2642)]|nr:hypothetical protein V501_02244 [Pseudogymnoascus sp. VKM F-4519 (FW-2642)]
MSSKTSVNSVIATLLAPSEYAETRLRSAFVKAVIRATMKRPSDCASVSVGRCLSGLDGRPIRVFLARGVCTDAGGGDKLIGEGGDQTGSLRFLDGMVRAGSEATGRALELSNEQKARSLEPSAALLYFSTVNPSLDLSCVKKAVAQNAGEEEQMKGARRSEMALGRRLKALMVALVVDISVEGRMPGERRDSSQNLPGRYVGKWFQDHPDRIIVCLANMGKRQSLEWESMVWSQSRLYTTHRAAKTIADSQATAMKTGSMASHASFKFQRSDHVQ